MITDKIIKINNFDIREDAPTSFLNPKKIYNRSMTNQGMKIQPAYVCRANSWLLIEFLINPQAVLKLLNEAVGKRTVYIIINYSFFRKN